MKKIPIILSIVFLTSCASNKNFSATDGSLTKDFLEETELPVELMVGKTGCVDQGKDSDENEGDEKIFRLVYRGIKIEMEETDFVDCLIVQDDGASKKKSLAFSKDSRAWAKVLLPEGKFEILFSQKAFSTSGSHLKITVEKNSEEDNQKKIYWTYPSEPPLGSFELTIRKPIFIETERPTEILVTVETDEWETKKSLDHYLDYMQIVMVD